MTLRRHRRRSGCWSTGNPNGWVRGSPGSPSRRICVAPKRKGPTWGTWRSSSGRLKAGPVGFADPAIPREHRRQHDASVLKSPAFTCTIALPWNSPDVRPKVCFARPAVRSRGRLRYPPYCVRAASHDVVVAVMISTH